MRSAAPAALLLLLGACGAKATAPHFPAPRKELSDAEKSAKAWKNAIAKATRREGFLPLWKKPDGGTLIELTADRLEHELGLMAEVNHGIGDVGMSDGLPLSDTKLVRFSRQGDRVLLIARDSFLVAPPESAWQSGIDQDRAESVLAALPIVAEDEAHGRLLLDATAFLLSDFGDIGKALAPAYEGKEPALDKERSRVVRESGFPRNTEIDVALTFASTTPPPFGFYGVADPRSLLIGVRFSFFALPETPMQPRLADDRVGYFNTIHFDPSQGKQPWIAFVNRWRLEKQHPEAAMSEPIQPIVYYLDSSIPEEWRPFIKQGIESWNDAFADAGFEHAVVVREDLPEDYSPEDIRYSTIRWVPSYGGTWGFGPSQTDPRTGEILNADILIGGNVLRSGDIVRTPLLTPTAPGGHSCAMAEGSGRNLASAQILLAASGRPVPKELVGDVLRVLAAHEVGHTLGLRHNFRSSASIPFDRLQDKEFTGKNGLVNSVMDYWDINISPDPGKQGYFVQPGLGAYDHFAIRFGYSTFAPADEASGLAAISKDAGAPLNAFQTDEDTRLGPYTVDPYAGLFDLGDDPIRFARERIHLIDAALPGLDRVALDDGDSYYELRRVFTGLLNVRSMYLNGPMRLVGGRFVARVHKGQAGERPTFIPVTAERQRAAVSTIVELAFAPGAWPLPPQVLALLAPWRGGWRGNGHFGAVDFPAHQIVLGLQTDVLTDLLHPARLNRIVDGTLLVPAGQAFSVTELFALVTDGIWSEFGASAPRNVDTIRANLQLAHVDLLSALLLPPSANPTPPPAVATAPWDAPPPELTVPAEARAAARAELERLAARVKAALRSKKLDARTRAHLGEARARIERSLNASKTLASK